MDNTATLLVSLYGRYIDNTATKEELAQFLSLMEEPANQTLLEELLDKTWDGLEEKKDSNENSIHLKTLQEKKGFFPVYKIKRFQSVAASVLVLVCVAAYLSYNFLRHDKKATQKKAAAAVIKDVAPGGNNAVLTLSDGSTIVLNNAKNGNLAEQGNSDIVKLANGQLAYKHDGSVASEILYNTVTTPVGGQYQLTLSDGTKVWLNAASSIHFPASFAGKERQVDITGEAYFEVAKNKHMPFLVKVKDMTVKVLGTHFNVMAYDEEQLVKTTLLEGKVNVTSNTDEAFLLPGQQASSVAGKTGFKVKEADTGEATAWITGFFQFEKADTKTIMRQLARWYDIEVVYEAKNDSRRFGGRMNRNQNLSEVLHVLELNNLHFKTEGRKITVLP